MTEEIEKTPMDAPAVGFRSFANEFLILAKEIKKMKVEPDIAVHVALELTLAYMQFKNNDKLADGNIMLMPVQEE